MDWCDCMRGAIDYVEKNLKGAISFDKAAQIACCSTYHFQRMFSFIIGIPLSEYIRRRRMTLAAFELQNTSNKIVDIAYSFGYESPEAFSRAFQKMHGVPPKSARDNGVMLKAYPRISFQICIRGDIEMDYRIEEKESFEVFGMELKTNVIDGKCYKEIPAFWTECGENGKCEQLLKDAGNDSDSLIDAGVTYNHNPNDGGMSYLLACVKKPQSNTGGYTVITIPKQTWAVFATDWHNDSDDALLHQAWRKIYSEWFPTSGYEHADCDVELEMYFGKRGNGSVEIWIPVQKAKV